MKEAERLRAALHDIAYMRLGGVMPRGPKLVALVERIERVAVAALRNEKSS